MSRNDDAERIRDSVLDDAVRAGKIEAGARDEYRRMYDAQPAAIRRLLTARVEEGGLMPGLRGPGEDPATAAPGGYDESWLSPIERERVARARGGPSPAPSAPPAQPQRASTTAAEGSGEQYDPNWLSAEERERVAAAKEGRLTNDPVQFEGPEARAAPGAARR